MRTGLFRNSLGNMGIRTGLILRTSSLSSLVLLKDLANNVGKGTFTLNEGGIIISILESKRKSGVRKRRKICSICIKFMVTDGQSLLTFCRAGTVCLK